MFTKGIESLLRNFQSFFILRSVKTLQDDCNEKIQKNERHDEHEADEEDICTQRVATLLAAVLLHAVVVLRRQAVEDD